jgi:hypothetical protein
LKTGRKRPLTENDLHRPLDFEESKYLTDQLETFVFTVDWLFWLPSWFIFYLREWKKEMNKKNPSLTRVLIRLYWFRFFIASLCVLSKVCEKR